MSTCNCSRPDRNCETCHKSLGADTVTDWINEIAAERRQGFRRPLLQSQHDAVNARYPGLTVKHCPVCDCEIDDAQAVCADCPLEEAT